MWLWFDRSEWNVLQEHLLPEKTPSEQAAFVLMERSSGDRHRTLGVRHTWLLRPDDFEFQSEFHIEIQEEVWDRSIKWAHDSGCALGEFHSHRSTLADARFSASDVSGFADNVPYIRWRLHGWPYVACVLSPTGLDGWLWADDSRNPRGISGIRLSDGSELRASNASTWGISDVFR